MGPGRVEHGGGANGSEVSRLSTIIRLGQQLAPAQTAVAVGALVLFAIAIFILNAQLPFGSVLFAASVVLILGVIAASVSQWVTSGGAKRGLLPQAIAWAFVSLFVIVCGLFVSSVFFSLPEGGALFIAHQLRAPALIPVPSQQAVKIQRDMDLGEIDARLLQAELPSADDVALTAALARLPPLQVQNAVLMMRPGEIRSLATSELSLSNATIVTNGGGGRLTITALRIISDNASIRAFEHPERFTTGQAGANGGTVELRIERSTSGLLSVDLSGQAGAPGGNGAPGDQGTSGSPGDNAASGLFDCSHGAGRGGNGGPGQSGETGHPGLDGGDGGNLVLYSTSAALADHISFASNGGAPGPGGAGGQGGLGGPGGPGGSPRGLCQGHGPPGVTGPRGADGPAGIPGKRGQPGQKIVRQTIAQ